MCGSLSDFLWAIVANNSRKCYGAALGDLRFVDPEASVRAFNTLCAVGIFSDALEEVSDFICARSEPSLSIFRVFYQLSIFHLLASFVMCDCVELQHGFMQGFIE